MVRITSIIQSGKILNSYKTLATKVKSIHPLYLIMWYLFSFIHLPPAGSNDSENDSDTPGQCRTLPRGRTSPSPDPPSPRARARVAAGQGPGPTGERLRIAKLTAEKAIKVCILSILVLL